MSYYRTIKELVIKTCIEEGRFPSYEKLTALVRQHFPTSKWKETHYAWYKSKIKTGAIQVPGLSEAREVPYQRSAVRQPVPLARNSDVSVSTEQLADWRRKLVRMLSVLEKDSPPLERPGVGKRIGLLQRSGIIPAEIAAMMRTVTELRNAVEYQNKTLSAAERSAVRAAWSVIQEWADDRGIDVLR